MTNATTPQPNVNDASLAGARAWFHQRGLSRPREGRLLAGVSAAFARRYDVNPLVARIVTVATVVTLTPLVYVAAWILMPAEAPAPAAAAPAAAAAA
jgi:phage shock protein C